MLRRVLKYFRDCFGWVILKSASPFAAAMRVFIPDNLAYDIFSRHGYHLLRKHYYLPIPDETDLNDPLLKSSSELVGIDMQDENALQFIQEVYPKYQEEFQESFPNHGEAGEGKFFLVNGAFMAGDAHVYYTLIRHHRPKRIVEIGGGNSSMLASVACLKNQQEFGEKPHLTVVEPYPHPYLKDGIDGMDELIEKRVQEVDMELFTSLEAGDILFIDSSHVLRPGGDVHREYCEILPRIAPGVFVHIHDISLPKPYFPFYFKNHLYWNEQYLLQAFLSYNSGFEVIWPGTYMFEKYPEEVTKAFPEIKDMREKYPLAEPSSFWLRRTEVMIQSRAA